MDNSERFEAGEGGSSYELDTTSPLPPDEYDDLDADRWSSLPPHLIEKILAWLPIPSFLRFRTVCKTWNKLLQSPGFLRECYDVPSQGPWFLMFKNDHYREAATYNPSLDCWHPIPLLIASAPGQISFHVAAAGGLLCYYAAECDSVVVCNPLTRCWRKLPPTLRIQFFQPVGMVIDRATQQYKVVVAGIWATYGACYPTAEVFDSTTNTWTITSNTPPNFPLHPPGILCNDTLYWRCHEPHGLTTYDLRSHSWSQLHAPLPSSFESYGLVQSRGTIFVIGRLEDPSAAKSISILKLHQPRLVWEEVDRMPPGLLEEFLKDAANDAYFRCIGHSDLVLISMCGRNMPQLLYDLARRVWRRLPRCPMAEHRMVDGFSFEPRLDASV
ncbi:hypothetical protein M758_7G068800 [Ceratodon purpureus]|nr:hypothetical protein M758_7G068800 [Ceratodon purpureus]